MHQATLCGTCITLRVCTLCLCTCRALMCLCTGRAHALMYACSLRWCVRATVCARSVHMHMLVRRREPVRSTCVHLCLCAQTRSHARAHTCAFNCVRAHIDRACANVRTHASSTPTCSEAVECKRHLFRHLASPTTAADVDSTSFVRTYAQPTAAAPSDAAASRRYILLKRQSPLERIFHCATDAPRTHTLYSAQNKFYSVVDVSLPGRSTN